MIGTGFMKCIPITLSFLVVASANFVMEIDEVFDAIMVFFGHFKSSSLKIDFFNLKFSLTTSITRSAFKIESKSDVYLILPTVFSASDSVIFSLLTIL